MSRLKSLQSSIRKMGTVGSNLPADEKSAEDMLALLVAGSLNCTGGTRQHLVTAASLLIDKDPRTPIAKHIDLKVYKMAVSVLLLKAADEIKWDEIPQFKIKVPNEAH